MLIYLTVCSTLQGLAPKFHSEFIPINIFLLLYSSKSTNWWQFPNVLIPLNCCICCHLTVSFVCFLSMLATAYRTLPERKLHYYWPSSFHGRPNLLFLLVLFFFFTHSSPGLFASFPPVSDLIKGYFPPLCIRKGPYILYSR